MEQKNAISRRLFFGGTLSVGALSLLQPFSAYAEPDAVAAKQAEADKAYEQLLEKQAVLDRASNDYHRAEQAQEEARALMEDARQRIAGESARIAEYQEQLSLRARDMYRSGTESYLDVLLGSASFEEFANNWSILNSMNAADAALVKRSKESRQAMANAKATYEVEKKTASREAAAAKEVHDEAMKTVEEIEKVYESLSAEAAELLREREAQQASITDSALIAQLIEQGTEATAQWAAAQGVQAPADNTPAPSAAEEATDSNEETTGSSTEEDSAPEPEVQEPATEPAAEVQPVQEAASTAAAGSGSLWQSPIDMSTTAIESATSTSTDSDLGSRIVNNSLQYLGWDYVWGGKSPASGGFDCSGFVGYVYGQSGSYAPAWTGSLINYGVETDDPQPGDICVIHEESGDMRQHTGIYYGNGQMVHASTYGTGVIISPSQEGMTYRHVG